MVSLFLLKLNGFNLHQSIDKVGKMMENLRGGSRTAATSKKDRFVTIINSWKPLTIITKRSFLDVAAALDPPLNLTYSFFWRDSYDSHHGGVY